MSEIGTMAKKYTKSDVETALKDIREKRLTVYGASKLYKIPKTTLLYKYEGKYSIDAKAGPSTILSYDEENILEDWVIEISKAGFPVNSVQLLDSVSQLVKKLNRPNKFKNGRPGRKWLTGFMKRHPNVSKRTTQLLPKHRTLVTQLSIENWFNEVKNFLITENYFEILDDPVRVFNCDETAFFICPKPKSVLAQKGAKNVHSTVSNSEKENYTTLIMTNAEGTLPPPMVIFPYTRRIPAEIVRKCPSRWGIGMSENGWMTSETFYEYITNIFYPWLLENKIQMPIILFVDGHKSHLTLDLSKFCKKMEIILISLLANSTHFLQPLDVALFHPLKEAWKSAIINARMEKNGLKLSRPEFAPLLETVIVKTVKKEILKNGFRACGLCPFNKNAINYSKLPSGIIDESAIRIPNKSKEKSFLNIFESKLSSVQLNEFKKFEFKQWDGSLQSRDLFNYWKKLKIEAADIVTDTTEDIQNTSLILLDGSTMEELTEMNSDILSGLLNEHDYMEVEVIPNVFSDTNKEHSDPNDIAAPQKTPLKNIPTPFKSTLFWPQKKNEVLNKRRATEKLPSVAISDKWISYHETKKRKYEQKENEKLENKKKRELKKLSKTMVHNIEKESPDNIKNTKKNITKNSFVIVVYEEEYFPGCVLDIKDNQVFVKTMVMSGPNWKWPEKEDQIWYNINEVVESNVIPNIVNARGIYSIPAIHKYQRT